MDLQMICALDTIRSVLNKVADPHEFATAYVNHVETTGERPSVLTAALNFNRTGRI